MYGGSKRVCCAVLSHSVVSLCDPWTIACRAPLSMGLSRQAYWSELSCPPPGNLPNLGIKPRSPKLQADSLPSLFPGGSVSKESACNAGDPSSVPV